MSIGRVPAATKESQGRLPEATRPHGPEITDGRRRRPLGEVLSDHDASRLHEPTRGQFVEGPAGQIRLVRGVQEHDRELLPGRRQSLERWPHVTTVDSNVALEPERGDVGPQRRHGPGIALYERGVAGAA